jgi:WD40 repeat protein
VLLLLGLVGLASTAIAQTPGVFTRTGDAITIRALHTATLLPDGRVLIAGGVKGSVDSVTGTAELYDPATGIFTATGQMTSPRRSHAAAVLPDGRVLIAGGFGPLLNPPSPGCTWLPSSCNPLASAELYDPSTGTFTRTGDMIASGISNGGGRAILLPNGKVFIAANLAAQLYDPTTGTFTAAGPYIDNAPAVYTATLLADGKVLITGCNLATCNAGMTELYDPATDTFSLTSLMSDWYSVSTATLLASGQVLFVGHSDETALPAEAEVYDPKTGTFAPIGNTIWPHDGYTATLLPGGTVLIAGTRSLGGAGDARAEIYDPVLATFSTTGSMATARYWHTATLLRDGRVLIAGGANDSGWLTSAELYGPQLPDLWQQAITAMKTAAGTDSLNFWQWAWYWQRSPVIAGAPTGFGILGSIDNIPGLIDRIVAMGGGDGSRMVSADQWVIDYRQAICAGCWDY